MDNVPYYTDKDGVTRIKPCESMTINGKVYHAGTEIKLPKNVTTSEEVTDEPR